MPRRAIRLRRRSIRLRSFLAAALLAAGVLAAGAAGAAALQVTTGASTLTFTTQPPAAATGGVPFSRQPIIHDADAAGNPRPGEPVTLGIAPGTGTPGALLSCHAMTLLTDDNGNVGFSECFVDKAGMGYRLVAQVLFVESNAATSDLFNVVPGPPSQLSFVQQPVEAFVAHPFDLVVGITDAGRNVVSTGVSATVTLAVGPDDVGDVTLSCPGGLSRSTATSGPEAGTATFSGCTLDDPNANGQAVELEATASGVTGAASLLPASSAGIPLGPAFEAPLPGLVLVPSPTVVSWGLSVSLTVEFAGGGGRSIEIQRSLDLETWTSIGQLTTDATGRAALSYRPRTTGFYRAVFHGPPATSAGSTDAHAVLVRLAATQTPVHSSTTILGRGTTVTFSAKVGPVGTDVATPRVAFYVYRRVAGSWHLTATRVVSTNTLGVARLTWRFGTAGEHYVRSKAMATWHHEADEPGTNLESLLTPIARYLVR